MSKSLNIVLLEDVSGVGEAGQVVAVSEGYARNFLFPQGKAALADEATASAVEAKQKQQEAAEDEQLQKMQDLASALEGTELTIAARLKEGEGEEIFGSINARQIAKALSDQIKHKFSGKDIDLPEALTKTGTTSVTVRVSPEVEAIIHVTVAADGQDT